MVKCSVYLFGGMLIICFLIAVSGCRKEEQQAASSEPAVGNQLEDNAGESSPGSPAPSESPRTFQDEVEAVPGLANEQPQVESVELSPFPAFPGDTLTAEVQASDPDGDLVDLEYDWLRNGEEIFGAHQAVLETDTFAKGDLISVSVTPFDGKERGEAKESKPALLHNRPPEITSFPPAQISEGRYVYQVETADPDGDRLSYALEGAPPGMEVDAESGLVDWKIPQDMTGDFQIRIMVSDGDARAYQSFSMKVAPENR